ncbi:hypothetical protein [Clostridium sp.]|uniref:hypothetical protein n=1 Tax=Clostridium sp. TaxID=1506 RepID=UPI00290B8465|nr:hypothetical protein [Clostridium sp.]MDU5107839.1 hypothetical protein [Clostridium sp.]
MNNNYIKTFNNTIQECPDRVDSLRKYFPLYYLYNYKYTTLPGYEHINFCEVCLSLLSFMFYENKLKNQKIRYTDIKDFLEMLLNSTYDIYPSPENLDKFTTNLLDKIQGENGAGHKIEFPIYDIGKDLGNVKYITSSGDEESGRQGYKITSLAIDLLLATKEFSEESKITISLLLLKKLITDNDYDNALLSLTQVNAEVIKQISRVYDIEIGLVYGGSAGYKAFENYRKLADKRQKDEEELFSETMEQVRLLREEFATKVSKSEFGEKEKNAFRCLDEMDKELNKTVQLHQQLLGKVVILTRKADEILKQKRIKLLRPSFDFMTYLDKLNKCGSAENLRHFVSPFMPLNIEKQFSLGRINDMIISKTLDDNKIEDSKEEEKIKIDTDKFNRAIRKRVRHNYRYVLKYFYNLLKEHDEISMEDILKECSEEDIEDIFKNPDFVGVIIDLLRLNEKHYLGEENKNKSNSKIKKANDDEESSGDVLLEILESLTKRYGIDYYVSVEPIQGSYIEIAPGFNMTNVIIRKRLKGEII